MRNITRRIILIFAALLAIFTIVFILIALWRHLGWQIPTILVLAAVTYLGALALRNGGIKKFISFMASVLAIAGIGFAGWAIWNHHFAPKNEDSNSGSSSNVKIEENSENSSDSKNSTSENSDSKDEKAEETSNSSENSNSSSNANSSNSANTNSNQNSQNSQTPAELPKTGFTLE